MCVGVCVCIHPVSNSSFVSAELLTLSMPSVAMDWWCLGVFLFELLTGQVHTVCKLTIPRMHLKFGSRERKGDKLQWWFPKISGGRGGGGGARIQEEEAVSPTPETYPVYRQHFKARRMVIR